MKKRNYTHVQVLLPEIKAMLAEGKTQQEVAEYYGFRDKQVVKRLLERERRKERKPEAAHSRKGGREKMPRQEILWQSRPMRSNGLVRKINYCGIFCASQEGSEGNGKGSYHLSSWDRVSSGSYVQILWSVQKRLLCFCPSSGQAGTGRSSCEDDCTAAGTQFSHLRLSADVTVAETPKYFLQSQNCAADYEEVCSSL